MAFSITSPVIADMDAPDPRGKHIIGLYDISSAGGTVSDVEAYEYIQVIGHVPHLLHIHDGRHLEVTGGSAILNAKLMSPVEAFKIIQSIFEYVAGGFPGVWESSEHGILYDQALMYVWLNEFQYLHV